jgi:PIN domain nuclease of toxin-antitoxin system
MKVLLDTHIFLWLIQDDKRLSDEHRQLIQNPNNEKFLSVVSIWECVIKHQIGKLEFPSPPAIYLPLERRKHLIKALTVDENTIARLTKLPLLHRDPFDRLIMAHALHYDLIIATVDTNIRSYSVETI